jgi:hypothetical protein
MMLLLGRTKWLVFALLALSVASFAYSFYTVDTKSDRCVLRTTFAHVGIGDGVHSRDLTAQTGASSGFSRPWCTAMSMSGIATLASGLSLSRACTRVAIRGQGAPHAWPPSPRRSRGIPASRALPHHRMWQCAATARRKIGNAQRLPPRAIGCWGRSLLIHAITAGNRAFAVRCSLFGPGRRVPSGQPLPRARALAPTRGDALPGPPTR